ncbi:uncharacterized protein FOMMEDRAFT_43675, partial [Fomitiporia mediterranea MF3/22]
ISLTLKELLSIAPDVRKQVKELSSARRVPNAATHLVSTEPSEPTTSEDAIVAQVSQHAWSPESVAEQAMPLRTVKAIFEDTEEIHCILDQGATLCIIREDVWKRLGIHLRSDLAIMLETADSGQAPTLGAVENVKINIAGVDIALQAQVVRQAPFEALLGRPFFAITECETKDFINGDQSITLSDPS